MTIYYEIPIIMKIMSQTMLKYLAVPILKQHNNLFLPKFYL
jgi:hypothetical protein